MTEPKVANMFKAFCDTNRIKIINILIEGETCACKLLEKLSISQSTLSHHMKILVDSEMVRSRKQGKWVHYSINKEKLEKAKEYLESLQSCKTDGGFCCG